MLAGALFSMPVEAKRSSLAAIGELCDGQLAALCAEGVAALTHEQERGVRPHPHLPGHGQQAVILVTDCGHSGVNRRFDFCRRHARRLTDGNGRSYPLTG